MRRGWTTIGFCCVAALWLLQHAVAGEKPSSLGVIVKHGAEGSRVRVSSTHTGEIGEGKAEGLVDGDLRTRWSSDYSAPQEVIIHLAKPMKIETVRLHWESAAATKYAISVSSDGRTWKQAFLYFGTGNKPGQRRDDVHLKGQAAGWIRLSLEARTSSDWGFSLYEVEVHGKVIELPSK